MFIEGCWWSLWPRDTADTSGEVYRRCSCFQGHSFNNVFYRVIRKSTSRLQKGELKSQSVVFGPGVLVNNNGAKLERLEESATKTKLVVIVICGHVKTITLHQIGMLP